ncbi:nucleotide exchange factor GrpE [Amycolatopsis sp. OK19-0408]|uniref:Nucleotide exchange factor GrpE n=1 Tax=Amycolatopsis iheyensis TaxID=2945988 RepID=A0A9X2NKG9_9PSEU|nr:nucleotide exchange factor GrpE [Amycolatopsis iheyensis]MCR6489462.1 nucleotide exchange factor GrpE [Amycolatopsis iheyensis]
MAWFRRDGSVDPDDTPTGQIAAVSIAQIIEEADAEKGTDGAKAASDTDVHPLQQQVSDLDRALADRQALIQMCLYALDRARSGGVVERLEAGLAAIGVHALRPDGERFDPARHEAGGAVPTEDPALEGIVAETEVTGFADHDRLLRAPIVTVYAKKSS